MGTWAHHRPRTQGAAGCCSLVHSHGASRVVVPQLSTSARLGSSLGAGVTFISASDSRRTQHMRALATRRAASESSGRPKLVVAGGSNRRGPLGTAPQTHQTATPQRSCMAGGGSGQVSVIGRCRQQQRQWQRFSRCQQQQRQQFIGCHGCQQPTAVCWGLPAVQLRRKTRQRCRASCRRMSGLVTVSRSLQQWVQGALARAGRRPRNAEAVGPEDDRAALSRC